MKRPSDPTLWFPPVAHICLFLSFISWVRCLIHALTPIPFGKKFRFKTNLDSVELYIQQVPSRGHNSLYSIQSNNPNLHRLDSGGVRELDRNHKLDKSGIDVNAERLLPLLTGYSRANITKKLYEQKKNSIIERIYIWYEKKCTSFLIFWEERRRRSRKKA
jgi:hypothetical protein